MKKDLEITKSKDTTAELAYKSLLQVRDLDDKLMWTRINVMLLIQGILFSFLASSFSSLINKYTPILILMEVFGLISAYFLWWVTKGGSFWVNFWERKLAEIESKAIGDFMIFREHPTTDPDIRKKLGKEGYKSTRKAIEFLSLAFLVVWLVIVGYTMYLYLLLK